MNPSLFLPDCHLILTPDLAMRIDFNDKILSSDKRQRDGAAIKSGQRDRSCGLRRTENPLDR